MVNELNTRYGVKSLTSFKVLMDYANLNCSLASIDVMLQHLLYDNIEPAWLTFITNNNYFKNVVSEIIAINKNDQLDELPRLS